MRTSPQRERQQALGGNGRGGIDGIESERSHREVRPQDPFPPDVNVDEADEACEEDDGDRRRRYRSERLAYRHRQHGKEEPRQPPDDDRARNDDRDRDPRRIPHRGVLPTTAGKLPVTPSLRTDPRTRADTGDDWRHRAAG